VVLRRADGTLMARRFVDRLPCSGIRMWIMPLTCAETVGAGEGNRTLMTSLGDR
jgi:hypothetical protein